MELSVLLAKEILSLFLMAAVGYVIVKCKLLHADDSKVLSILCVYVFSPCVIVNSFQMEYSRSKMAGLVLCFLVALVIQILFMIFTKIFGKIWNFSKVESLSLIYTNVGYLTIPLVLGVMGEEWTFYVAAYLIVFNVLIWSHGIILLDGVENISVKKVLFNPNVIACAVGLILFVLNIKLPYILGSSVSGLAKVVGPASMVITGMLLAKLDLKEMFRQKRVYLICFLRLIVLPLIVVLLLKISGVGALHPEGKQILCIVLISAAAPVANAVTQIAQIYDKEPEYVSLINGMSVILCIVTMPLIIFLYDILI